MICTTTSSFANREISAYCGVVAAEAVVSGASAGGSIEVVDGLSLDLAMQTSRFREARAQALDAIKDQANSLKADAIIGLRFEYCALGKNGLLNMVSAYGTAVRIQFSKEERERHRIAELREKTSFTVLIDGRPRGPFSIAQLAELVEQGRLSPSVVVQADDSSEAIPLSSLLSR